MVEMALVLPLYFLLVFGVIEMCLVLFGYCNATYACRQASRYAAVHGTGSTYQCTSTDLQTIASQYLWGAPAASFSVTSTWSPDNNPGSSVFVRISISYPTPIPYSSLHKITIGTVSQALILQ